MFFAKLLIASNFVAVQPAAIAKLFLVNGIVVTTSLLAHCFGWQTSLVVPKAESVQQKLFCISFSHVSVLKELIIL
jgi:hypothetical protein